jgi:hypothetical protein
MRKIEKEMLQAVTEKRDWHKDNTSVYFISAAESGNPYGSRSEVYLHNNLIAEFWHHQDKPLEVCISTLCRWPSMTTRSRLRALGADLKSIKGTLHLNGKSIWEGA